MGVRRIHKIHFKRQATNSIHAAESLFTGAFTHIVSISVHYCIHIIPLKDYIPASPHLNSFPTIRFNIIIWSTSRSSFRFSCLTEILSAYLISPKCATFLSDLTFLDFSTWWTAQIKQTIWLRLIKKNPTRCKQCIKILLFHIYMRLNMFRATHRPSSWA